MKPTAETCGQAPWLAIGSGLVGLGVFVDGAIDVDDRTRDKLDARLTETVVWSNALRPLRAAA